MKILCAFLLVMIFEGNVFGQKQNAVWVGGDKGEIQFSNHSAVSIKRKDNQFFWRTSASICDSNGNLLFYTNGFRVYNKLGKIMQNGDSLALGDYISFGYGLNATPDGAVIIPKPGNQNEYYLFFTDLNYISTELGPGLFPTHLLYSIVHFNSPDTSLGFILDSGKNVVLLSDTLTQFGIQAVRHGNGRDWWLICHEYGSNRYYKYLVTESGILGPYEQYMGVHFKLQGAGVASPMKFSQDGTQFLQLSFDSNRVELYNFDRCGGEFYNYRSFKVDTSFAYSYGASFSPSGRYIYVSVNENEIRQYDAQAEDITKSMKIVGIDNGVEDPFPANYYLHQLGRDGKIYISAYDVDYALHVINDPDSMGTACHFVEWGFPLIKNTDWGGGTPNLPNYNLGPSPGCDTLITNTPPISQSVFSYSVYPNPCTGKFQLSITGVGNQVDVVIYNTMGEVIEQTTLQPANGFILGFFNLQNEPAGVYLLKAQTNRGPVEEKILKQ